MHFFLYTQSRNAVKHGDLQPEIKWGVCYKAIQNVLLWDVRRACETLLYMCDESGHSCVCLAVRFNGPTTCLTEYVSKP